jgi:hypothetical protein
VPKSARKIYRLQALGRGTQRLKAQSYAATLAVCLKAYPDTRRAGNTPARVIRTARDIRTQEYGASYQGIRFSGRKIGSRKKIAEVCRRRGSYQGIRSSGAEICDRKLPPLGAGGAACSA